MVDCEKNYQTQNMFARILILLVFATWTVEATLGYQKRRPEKQLFNPHLGQKYRVPIYDTVECSASLQNTAAKYKNEDRILNYRIALKNGLHAHLHGVFDGHGGSEVSNMMSLQLPLLLTDKLNQIIVLNRIDAFSRRLSESTTAEMRDAIAETLLDIDSFLCSESTAFLMIGSTASFVLRIKDIAFVVNIGDSRTLVYQNDDLIYRTALHVPWKVDEFAHIYNAGGTISHREKTIRLNGMLAMSRAIGDCLLKVRLENNTDLTTAPVYDGSHGILRALPDITPFRMNLVENRYSFLSATDGLFDTIVDFKDLQALRRFDDLSASESRICFNIVRYARAMGSRDDISAVFVEAFPFQNSVENNRK